MTSSASGAEAAIQQITAAFTTTALPGVVVDSPPGAGKSTLVVRTATLLAAGKEPVMVVAQTNAQVDDLVVRIAQRAPTLDVGRLSGTDYTPSLEVRRPNVRISSDIRALAECMIIVGTASKWVWVTEGRWPWAIIDEAYQMRSDLLLRIMTRFEKTLFVGDPGQLDPFSTVETARWTGVPWDPMQSAVAVLLRNNPGILPYRLPVSWRLPPSAAPVVQRAFYPFADFAAGSLPSQRSMHVTVPGVGVAATDDVIDLASQAGWGFYELPARNTIRTDVEAVAATAAIATRLLQRGTETVCEDSPAGRRLTPDRIAIGAAHRDQVAAIGARLRALGGPVSHCRVDTANRLQGAEFDVVIVLHPLSGRLDATAFHLESGRLCVLTSRHRHACIVVGRAGIPELLDAHPSVEPVHLKSLVKFPDGWEANQAILSHLGQYTVPAI